MKVLFRRTASGLMPDDDPAREELRRLKIGQLVFVEIKAARNLRQHKYLFALLRLMVDHGVYPTTDAALTALKIATGHVDRLVIKDTGDVHLIPKSISFASMRQSEFAEWFDAALKVVATRWLEVAPDVLAREIEGMLG
jgi:hypothetical protein